MKLVSVKQPISDRWGDPTWRPLKGLGGRVQSEVALDARLNLQAYSNFAYIIQLMLSHHVEA